MPDNLVFIDADMLITGHVHPYKYTGDTTKFNYSVQVCIEDRQGEETFLLFSDRESLLELGHLVNHLLAETAGAPPEEGAPES